MRALEKARRQLRQIILEWWGGFNWSNSLLVMFDQKFSMAWGAGPDEFLRRRGKLRRSAPGSALE
jgi:hypothetical protein